MEGSKETDMAYRRRGAPVVSKVRLRNDGGGGGGDTQSGTAL